MPDAPGTEPAAYLAFLMVDELLSILIANERIQKSEAAALFENLERRLNKSNKAVAREAKEIARKMRAERGL